MRVAPSVALAAILLVGARLHWVEAEVMHIQNDDIRLMDSSHKIAGGEWRRVWTHQNIHWVPLYRLVRLPFDLNFPTWYVRFHALAVAAHLAGAAFLFLLSRRYLRSPWAAVAAALLFAWSTVGDEAIVWKAATPFVFSWTLVLAGMWCLTQVGRRWTLSAVIALCGAVGFFSGVLFVIPGIVVGVMLLEPGSRRRALGAGGAVWLGGVAVWAGLVAPQESLKHYWEVAAPAAGVWARLGWALSDTWNAYVWQLFLGVRLPYQASSIVGLAALAAALIVLRRRLNWRLVGALLLMTLPGLFVTMLIRRDVEVWKISRYGYQSFTFWAVTLAALLDAALWRLETRPRARRALPAVAAVAAALYLAAHAYVVVHHRDYFRNKLTNLQAFWFGWDSFFRLASAHRSEVGRPMLLPFVELAPGLYLHTVYMLCHPRGLPGLTHEHGAVGSAEQQKEFWAELEAARARSPALRQLPLPHLETAGAEPHVHAH